jgi:hypothetical protein
MFATLVGGCAAVGATISLFITVQLLRNSWTKLLQDHLAYGLLPLISYSALLVAAAMILKEHEYALYQRP